MGPAELLARLAATGLLCGPLAVAAHGCAARLAPEAEPAVRLTGAGVVFLGGLTLAFHLTAGLGVFGLEAMTLANLALAAALASRRAEGPSPPPTLAADLAALAARLAGLAAGPWRGAYLAAGALFAWAMLRAAAEPPASWDSLTYHLTLAGLWVQGGSTAVFDAPGAWSYYRWFPGGAELCFATAMLPFGSDALVGLVNPLALAWAWLAAGALARELGAADLPAELAALAVFTSPALFAQAATAYVEVLLTAATLAGLVFLVRARRTGRAGELVLAAAALGIAAGIKLPGLISSAATAGVALAVAAGDRLAGRRPAGGATPVRAWALGTLLAFAIGGPWYLRVWAGTGSPLYPSTVAIGGRVLHPGSAALAEMTRTIMGYVEQWMAHGKTEAEMLAASFEPVHGRPGPGALLALAGLGLGTLVLAGRGRGGDVLVVAAVAAAGLAVFFSGEMRAVRLWWHTTTGRFLVLPVAVGLVLAGAAAPREPGGWLRRGYEALVSLVLVVQLLADLPPAKVELTVEPGAVLVLALGLWALGRVGGGTPGAGTGWVIPALAGALALGLGSGLATRDGRRFAAWASDDVFELHPLRWKEPEVWAAVGRGDRPRVIAIAEGMPFAEHYGMLYPLLGPRLANRLVYVPVSPDGSYGDGSLLGLVRLPKSPERWVERLAASGAEVLACLFKGGIEEAWATRLPTIFRRIEGATLPMYWIDRDGLRALAATAQARPGTR